MPAPDPREKQYLRAATSRRIFLDGVTSICTRLMASLAIAAAIVHSSASDAEVPTAPRLACEPELLAPPGPDAKASQLVLKVGSREVILTDADGTPQELRVYPGGPDAVLVGYGGRDSQNVPYGTPTLWRVPCTGGAAKAFAHVDGADFGHSVLGPDARTLFFTGPDGIFTLDLATQATRRVTRASLAYCRKNEIDTRDVVGGFVDPHTLSFERGCGYEWEWHVQNMLAKDPGTPKMVTSRAPRPPFPSVAVDARGGVWLSDGLCDDPSTFGRLLRSTDHGEHWEKIVIKEIGFHPVRRVIADSQDASVLLAFTFACGSPQHVDPGWVFISRDAGKTFQPVTVPKGIPARANGYPRDEQDPIRAVVVPEGKVDHLIMFGESSFLAGNQVARWESRDAGRTWTALSPVSQPPQPAAPAIPSARGDFRLRSDGVYRYEKGKAPIRVYPRS